MGHPLPRETLGACWGTNRPSKSGTGWSETKSDLQRFPRPQPSSTTLLPVYGSTPTTTKGKADISEICQHMTQLEEAGCSLARVTTCRAHTGKQAHFNYFSFTTPRFSSRAPAKAGLVRTGEPRWREPKCVGGEADTSLCSHRRRIKAGTASLAAASHGRAARWPGPRHYAERIGLATFVWPSPPTRTQNASI